MKTYWSNGYGLSALLMASWLLIFNQFAASPARANLVINATFDTTITSDLNASVIEATINSVIALYEASFSDSVTVTIRFQEMTDGLGASSSYFVPGVAYSTFRTMLAAGATTVMDAEALAYLPATATNPVNGSTTISLHLANGRALGFGGPGWNPPSSQPDGTVYLNTSIMNLTRTSIDPSLYDMFATTAHEIDEVLGLVSKLDNLTNGAPAPTGDVGVMDLFRYDRNGNRSFNTSIDSQAYFSLNGTTRLAPFNQDDTGDFHDWDSPGDQTPRVQDAFATPGATPNPTVELIALDIIGYHLIVPVLAIAGTGTGTETISWSPNTPGFILQESTNLLSSNWVSSASGTNNPVIITNKTAVKLFRVVHP
jgi:hypothetical protein